MSHFHIIFENPPLILARISYFMGDDDEDSSCAILSTLFGLIIFEIKSRPA
jgi:hypothetical protein